MKNLSFYAVLYKNRNTGKKRRIGLSGTSIEDVKKRFYKTHSKVNIIEAIKKIAQGK